MRYFQKLKLVIFLKKILKIVVKRYGYTSYLHFTTSIGSTTKFLSLNVTINDQNSLFLINNSDDDLNEHEEYNRATLAIIFVLILRVQ